MYRAILISLLLTLTACGKDNSSQGSGVDQSVYDYYDANTGLKIQSNGHSISTFDAVASWHNTQACTGLSMFPAPFVAIVDDDAIETGGRYYYNEGVIMIKASLVNHTNQVLDHEFIHALIYPDITHDSPLFELCAPNT